MYVLAISPKIGQKIQLLQIAVQYRVLEGKFLSNGIHIVKLKLEFNLYCEQNYSMEFQS